MAKSKVKISELNKRIEFQQYSNAPDGQGGAVETWTTFATVWAKIEPVKQGERYFSQQIQPVRTHKIVIRKLVGLTTKMRFVHEGRIFQLKGEIIPDERDFYNFIDAVEGEAS